VLVGLRGKSPHLCHAKQRARTAVSKSRQYGSLPTVSAARGLRPVNNLITVDGEAKASRGRSKVAGFLGIPVGFPEKISYA